MVDLTTTRKSTGSIGEKPSSQNSIVTFRLVSENSGGQLLPPPSHSSSVISLPFITPLQISHFWQRTDRQSDRRYVTPHHSSGRHIVLTRSTTLQGSTALAERYIVVGHYIVYSKASHFDISVCCVGFTVTLLAMRILSDYLFYCDGGAWIQSPPGCTLYDGVAGGRLLTTSSPSR
ncbi:hypothetical protein EVAR_9362_1 [Eumeta japonica]|uniref:Uncharacterized protein n=1 Tax=Eumeta variegata TaxID=151549 RepID=A0A4C1YU01_EUMVA|nr:hypothetical protein EVAR_9362_1 [Eumeta japonica]